MAWEVVVVEAIGAAIYFVSSSGFCGLPPVNADVAKNDSRLMQWGKTSNADTETNYSDLTASLYLDNKWWMRLSLSHPPESRRLLVVGSVCWIISGLYFREPFQAGGVDL